MKREIVTGIQDFESLRINDRFYIDKTDFIRECWNGEDVATAMLLRISWNGWKWQNPGIEQKIICPFGLPSVLG